MTRSSLYIAALLTMALCLPPLQAQSGPDLALVESLIADGQAAQAYALLAPHEARLAGDLSYDYLLARSALDSGRAAIASVVYQRILAQEPDYAGVRFENARAYLLLKNYARAKQEFETVLRFQNLPLDLRSAAEQYAALAERSQFARRSAFSVALEYGFGYDDNINSAIAEAAIPLPGGLQLILDPLSQKREDSFHAVDATVEMVHALDGNWRVNAAVDYQGRLHSTETAFDYHDLEGRVGLGYRVGAHFVRLSARAGRFFVNDGPLRDVTGVRLDWIHTVNDGNQLSVTGAWSRYRFNDAGLQRLDFDSFALGASSSHAFAAGRGLLALSASLGYERETGGRIDGDKLFGGATLSLQGALTDAVGVFTFTGVQRGVYQADNTLFRVRRNDTVYIAGAGLTWSFTDGWALRPQLSWSKNRSNVSLNSYTRYLMSVNLRKTF